jgi:hypothetical protein
LKAFNVLVEACADIGVWRPAREPTAEELDMVRVPVLTRSQTLLGVPASLGTHPFLGLVAFDDSKGPLLFAGCTAPGLVRRLRKVGVAKKRMPLRHGAPAQYFVFTDIAIHNGGPDDGPAPTEGDSGGAVFRTLDADTGLIVTLHSFICARAFSGGGGARVLHYYTLTPAALALAQLRALPAFQDPASPPLEFFQPRDVVAAVGRSGVLAAGHP